MTTQLTAYRWVPEFAQGYVRDLRVRWALEEAGLPYEVVLVDATFRASTRYEAWQPFGQVPAYRDETVEMFESGAIVLHIAAKSEALAPRGEAGRAQVTTWVVAALNTIEPFAQTYIPLAESEARASWEEQQLLAAETLLDKRLSSLGAWLGDKDYLLGRFTAADIVMGTVLRELVNSGALARFPSLDAYRRRCEARPAFARAMEGQMRTFRENAPA